MNETPNVGAPALVDRISVLPDELRVPLDEPACGRDAVHRTHVGERRVGEALMIVVARGNGRDCTTTSTPATVRSNTPRNDWSSVSVST